MLNEVLSTELRVALHPIRAYILLDLHTRGCVSPSDFAERRELPIPNVAYHFRLLRDRGLIKLARAVPVRGTIEHQYRLTGQGEVAYQRLERVRKAFA